MFDWLFQLIPTFTPTPHTSYQGFVDFMINNRWIGDYITFCNRMTPGVVPPYPTEVPGLDLVWMWAAAVIVVFGLATWMRCKTSTSSC